MKKIDLHTHTDISDGSETPEAAVRLAKSLGLAAIAVTDHDTAAGVKRAKAEGEKCGVEVVSGIELGCGWHGSEVHMLGYGVDPDDRGLASVLDRIVRDRHERNVKMAKLLSDDGIEIDVAELERRHPGSVIGRPHFALCLVEAGIADSVKDAFNRFLDPGRKYYVRRHFLSLEEGAELIIAAGGRPVIAHPLQYKLSDEGMTELLEKAVSVGVCGLECRYSGYGEETVQRLLKLAADYGLCPTGGSDWHGSHKPHISMGSGEHGELCVPYDYLEALMKR